jgi:gas vesicle protein
MRREKPREVIYVERGDSSARWLFWGALLGAGLALLYAPRSGEETRRTLQRRLRRLRAATEERIDEFVERFSSRGDRARDMGSTGEFPLEDEDEDGDDDESSDLADAAPAPPRVPEPSAREEIERRLSEARARRRRTVSLPDEAEEPEA